jgi:hypothetical protein
MAYNPAERLRPAEINAMLADLSHLHAGFRAPAEHHNNGRMLAVSLGLLAAEASRDFFHGFVHPSARLHPSPGKVFQRTTTGLRLHPMKEAAWQKGSKDHHCGRSVSGNWQEKHRNCGRDGRSLLANKVAVKCCKLASPKRCKKACVLASATGHRPQRTPRRNSTD